MKINRFLVFAFVCLFLLRPAPGRTSAESHESPAQTVQRVCGRCHALQIMGSCMAGDCEGNRVVRVVKTPPWDLVVDWMNSMGVEMTETEKQAIQTYLQRSYPAKPYPLQWTKVPAHLGEGGWNVVSLREHGGQLYLGLEGSGRIFRSADGTRWQEVANTDHYTVYGITPFQGALYAGTHDPDPRIWKSTNGLNWRLEASLPPEERGVISLGIFKRWLYAGTGRARIYRSLDGRQWEQAGDLMRSQEASFPHWVRFLISFRNYLYAGLEQGPVYRTSDGVQWEPISRPITGQVGARGAAVFQSSLYVGTTGTGMIWRTRDGETWEKVFTAPSHIKRGYVSAMAAAGGALYASVDGYVYRSVDGARWEEVGNLGPHTLEAMAVFNNALYVGTLLPPQAQLYRASVIP